jgi:hypothetical protein
MQGSCARRVPPNGWGKTCRQMSKPVMLVEQPDATSRRMAGCRRVAQHEVLGSRVATNASPAFSRAIENHRAGNTIPCFFNSSFHSVAKSILR